MKNRFIEIRNKLLQRFADFVVERIRTARSEREVYYWFNLGMNINSWCVERDIWLN